MYKMEFYSAMKKNDKWIKWMEMDGIREYHSE
jgi:hypothetical protein